MSKKTPLIISSIVLITAMLACNLPSSQISEENLAATITAQALLIQNGQNPAPVEDGSITSTPTFTAIPEYTATVTLTPTPSVPLVSVSQNTNCRTGPGTQYDLISSLLIGQTAEVIGKNTITNTWIIKTPGGSGFCWLWGQYATVSGNTANLPEYPVPATPTPYAPSAPKDFKVHISCNLVNDPFLLNEVHIELSWADAANNEEGYKIYRDGSLLATLGENASHFEDDTTLAAIWLIGNPPPSVTYAIESYNSAGKSSLKDKTVSCP